MNNNINNDQFNLLVLMDFSEPSYLALKYAISIAKLTASKVHVCHIGNPGKIVKSDNPSIALEEIASSNNKIVSKLSSLVEIINTEGIGSDCHHTIGNIINEFESLIKKVKPKLIVIGKKEKNPTLSGKFTSYLLNRYSGSLLIISNESEFKSETKITVGCNENNLYHYFPELISILDKCTNPTLNLVNIKTPTDPQGVIDLPKTWQSFYTKNLNIQIEQKECSSIADGLNEHITKENIQLLCIGRGKRRNYLQNLISNQATTISQIIKKVQIPLLILGNNSESTI